MNIEQRLKKLSDDNPNYALLWAQWEFDKKLLSRALNSVSRDFPHYSLHDSSHSSTIITQIEKVIAPNIDKLSATDCWLLLESCYWHDAGMIITHDEKKDLLKDNNFNIYLQDLYQSDSDLAIYAKIVLDKKNKNDINQALLISNALTFIIADYFRKIHAKRSGEHVIDPDRIRVNSPRTSLIPQRLFNFVAEIVQCHGKKKESILEIAKYNDGMDAKDYAHPRYIAALLRIGDLLDIDDGRFCATLLANIGDVPKTSTEHQHKHASIKHLYIDSNVIEIKAECEMYGGYHAQQAWFDYIESEFDYQKRVWNDIVPASDYRALPTLGVLSCTIKDYITIDGKVPTLSLDQKRVYSYITGSQIYSERLPFIRELIQNSVDAIYYSAWEELYESESFLNIDESEKRSLFIKELEKNKIDIKYYKTQHRNQDSVVFSVKDTGTGMCLDDIKKFLKVGSESITSRKELLRTMPGWASPSGFFGIGLQAVFKMCSQVSIYTKKIESPFYEIIILNEGNEFFNISIKEIKDAKKKKFIGTEVTAIFDEGIIGAVSADSLRYHELNELLSRYDALEYNEDIYFHHYVNNIVSKDFTYSNIPITLLGNEISKDFDCNDYQPEELILESDYELGIDYNLKIDMRGTNSLKYKFKGVGFDTYSGFGAIAGVINIFNNDAGYWLTIDRKKGRTDRMQELIDLVEKVAIKNESMIRKNSESKAAADFFYFSRFDSTKDNLWHSYIINDNSVDEYLFKNRHLTVYNNNSFAMYNSTVPYIHEVSIILLKRIVKKMKFSLHAQLAESKHFLRDSQVVDVTYSLTFKNDGQHRFTATIDLIQEEIKYTRNTHLKRMYFCCYDAKYDDISIHRKFINDLMGSASVFSTWFDYVLIGPKETVSWAEDINNIWNFYKERNCLMVPEDRFKELYKMLWTELDLIK